jgi:hypothetical protein
MRMGERNKEFLLSCGLQAVIAKRKTGGIPAIAF